MKHVLCALAVCLIGFASLILANNIAVSCVNAAGQNTAAGVNKDENFRWVQCEVPWSNHWVWNKSSGRSTCFGVKTGGPGCASAPNASMGAGGASAPKPMPTTQGRLPPPTLLILPGQPQIGFSDCAWGYKIKPLTTTI